MRHRGICTCGWKGDWKQQKSDAEDDAFDHQTDNPLHETDVETEQ